LAAEDLRRRILFILTRPPYGSSLASEALDAALVAGVFDQDVSLLYMGEGLFQLLDQQHPELLQTRNHAKASRVLPEYDINQVYVHDLSMNSRGLSPADFVLPVEVLTQQDIKNLVAQQNAVLNF